MSKRNFKLTHTPKVETGSAYRPHVTLRSGGYSGATEVRVEQELDLWDTATLIRELRKGLRVTADLVIANAQEAKAHAEEPL